MAAVNSFLFTISTLCFVGQFVVFVLGAVAKEVVIYLGDIPLQDASILGTGLPGYMRLSL